MNEYYAREWRGRECRFRIPFSWKQKAHMREGLRYTTERPKIKDWFKIAGVGQCPERATSFPGGGGRSGIMWNLGYFLNQGGSRCRSGFLSEWTSLSCWAKMAQKWLCVSTKTRGYVSISEGRPTEETKKIPK